MTIDTYTHTHAWSRAQHTQTSRGAEWGEDKTHTHIRTYTHAWLLAQTHIHLVARFFSQLQERFVYTHAALTQLAYLFHQCRTSLSRDCRMADCTVRHPGVEHRFFSSDFLLYGWVVNTSLALLAKPVVSIFLCSLCCNMLTANDSEVVDCEHDHTLLGLSMFL